jgi:hypothetical protein
MPQLNRRKRDSAQTTARIFRHKHSNKPPILAPSPDSCRTGTMNCWRKRGWGIFIMFNTGHALPLVETRISRPRMVRVADAQQPHSGDGSRPQQQPVRDLGFATIRAQSRTIHGHKQTVTMFCPRPQTRQQAVHKCGQAPTKPARGQAKATDSACPRPVREFGKSTTTGRLLTKTGGGLHTVKARLSHRIGVSVSPPTAFHIHIRLAPTYGLI